MPAYEQDFAGMPRHQLEAFAMDMKRRVDRLAPLVHTDVLEMTKTLTIVQERCDQLLIENRTLRSGIVFPGWRCTAKTFTQGGRAIIDGKPTMLPPGEYTCGTFNGSEKEVLKNCRGCNAPKPE